jgi:hypothetical protein
MFRILTGLVIPPWHSELNIAGQFLICWGIISQSIIVPPVGALYSIDLSPYTLFCHHPHPPPPPSHGVLTMILAVYFWCGWAGRSMGTQLLLLWGQPPRSLTRVSWRSNIETAPFSTQQNIFFSTSKELLYTPAFHFFLDSTEERAESCLNGWLIDPYRVCRMQDLFGRSNYEYYARLTGRILKGP